MDVHTVNGPGGPHPVLQAVGEAFGDEAGLVVRVLGGGLVAAGAGGRRLRAVPRGRWRASWTLDLDGAEVGTMRRTLRGYRITLAGPDRTTLDLRAPLARAEPPPPHEWHVTPGPGEPSMRGLAVLRGLVPALASLRRETDDLVAPLR